ncbi:MAG: response regulator [Tannerella sp.]|nr:response regulator [Tannerella sp.]
MRTILATFLCLFICLSMVLADGTYVFRHIDIADGLADNQIRSITMTADGRLSVTARTSLNIYDGVSFEYIFQNTSMRYYWNYNRFLKDRYSFREYYDVEGRLWTKTPTYLTLFDVNRNSFIANIDSVLNDFGVSGSLKNLFIDAGSYWFLTEDNVLSRYDVATRQLSIVDECNGDDGLPYEMAMYKNLCWILYSGGLLKCYDADSGEFIMKDDFFTDKINEASNFVGFKATSNGDLWLMYNHAVYFCDRISRQWRKMATISGTSNFFTCMALDRDENVWVGTSWSGLRRIDAISHNVDIINVLPLDNGGYINNDIQCVFVDPNNGLWVGTLWQGICYYNPARRKFKLVQTRQAETHVTNESIRCFFEDDDGTILLGTAYDGVLRYNPKTGDVSLAFENIVPKGIVLSFYRDRSERLWIGTFLSGFYCIDGKTVRRYNNYTLAESDFTNQNVSRSIYEDPNGRFWVSVANQGVGELFPETGKIVMLRDKHPEIAFHRINFGFYPIDNNMFAAYGESGVYFYNTNTDSILIPPENANLIHYCIIKDHLGRYLYGTEQGIRIFDPRNRQSYTVDMKNGLPNNNVYSIEEDDSGIFWASTATGITKIGISDDYKFSLVNFDRDDGLQNGKFFENSSLKTRDGVMYFGGYNGFNIFNPSQMTYNESDNKPVFTALRLFNSPIDEKTQFNDRKILDYPLRNTKEIRLRYNENYITIEFSGLNFVNPARTYFRYKLENYEQNWNETPAISLGSATYTGLLPGTYRFSVYSANSDKVWSKQPAEITFIISPPFWKTIYAYIIYALVIAMVIILIIRLVSAMIRRRREEKAKIEKEKQKAELDRLKARFFTNVSHEFRTPLTLILSPLEALIKTETNENLRSKLSNIRKNVRNLLDLVNQLLDFRKLEMKGEVLHLGCGDIVEFTEMFFHSFKDMSESEQKDIILNINEETLYMYFDSDKLLKILNNLLSNAFKYTPVGGCITVSLAKTIQEGREYALLQVADSGAGIPAEKLEHIFERFYQVENRSVNSQGSGIGLHLVQEYVNLHQGQITVESQVGKGSVFSVMIPTDLQPEKTVEAEDKPERLEAADDEVAAAKSTSGNKHTIEIVEDNAEFRRFMTEQLSDKYLIIEASDGEEGEQLALKEFPDLLITDLMMPKVDGVELCKRIKSNIETSHIPVIMLTARASEESRYSGYEAGADEYISKPFNLDILLLRITKLIEQQDRHKAEFHKTVEVSPSKITITSLDEKLLSKALQCVENNIDNTEYSISDLGEELGLSRPNLYRKIGSITGETPADFIRSIRLKRAAQLLRDTDLSISEVADSIGFNNIKYFNIHFKEAFSATPSKYRKNVLR